MARRKSARYKRRRQRKELDLDINSLLDILVILLVFLLKSYSATELEIKMPKGLEIPNSKSRDYGNVAPVVKVTKTGAVYLGKEEIIPDLSKAQAKNGLLAELYNRLLKIKNGQSSLNNDPGRSPAQEGVIKKNDDKTINLVLDKDLDYSIIRKIMHTSGSAGFGKFKFLVKGEDE